MKVELGFWSLVNKYKAQKEKLFHKLFVDSRTTGTLHSSSQSEEHNGSQETHRKRTVFRSKNTRF